MQDKKQSLVPELRFPGFEGEWKNVKIKDLFKITRGKVLAMQQVSNKCVLPFIYPVFSSQTMNGGLAGYYNDYLYENAITWTTDGANAGEVNYRAGKFYCTNVCGVLLSDDGYANLCIASILGLVAKLHVSYVGNPKLMNNVMAEIEIAVPPSFAEQQKIAECLSSVDDLIQAEADQLQALKDHKKGLMQQLFPQEGETTPKLRFPGFEGEWEEKKFKDFTFSAGKKNKQNLPYERYSISNETGFCPQNDQFEGGGGYLKDIDCRMYIIVSPMSFAYNPARINVGSIGYQNLGKDVIVSSLYEVFQTTDICDDTFLWQWFKSNAFRKMVVDVQEGGVRQYFYYNKLQECSIHLPSLPEQQKIAECLSSLDEGIAAQQEKVEALREHKKGLMQKLFPSV